MAIVEELEFPRVQQQSAFELRFQDLFRPGRGLSFPCDAGGQVLLEGLSAACRANYRHACESVGRLYGVPCVQRKA